ncbi:surfactant protein Bb [Micropterus salmoides]|uniref:surfactant protein Bb n=2 Tax=Micropterus TaxID=27705 RepID=UPI0018ECC2D7|nr:surfactant protein Bb [Micropterus salmoides]XP_045890386.1 surfactant protein Bb isoform X1 [Micropterus dolomieu]
MSASGFLLVVLAVSLWPGDSRFITDPLSFIEDESLTLDICSECSQIVQLSANMISSRDTKENVYETLHALCQRLPGEQASECDSHVKMYLPKVLQQTPGHLKPGETCMGFGLCAAHNNEDLLKLTHHGTNKDTSISALGTATRTHEQFNPACTLCLFIIKKLETLLPQNMTEDALKKLMEEVCDLVPQSYKERCDDFVEKYGVQIVEFLLSSAAPHTICTLLHLCLFKEQLVPEVSLPSDCESCRTLAVLSRLHQGPNSTEPQTTSFLQSVCVHHPNAIPKCEVFTKIYGSRLQKVLGNQMGGPHACERADLCVASKKLEPLGMNRCTWGPSYWCKDIQTAQKCGNQAFCEKYMWKE